MSVKTAVKDRRKADARVPVLVAGWDRDHVAHMIPTDGEYTCGASPDCDIWIDLSGVAQHHCTLVLDQGVLSVRRESGRVWVNDVPIHSVSRLTPGEILAVGPAIFRIDAIRQDRHGSDAGSSHAGSPSTADTPDNVSPPAASPTVARTADDTVPAVDVPVLRGAQRRLEKHIRRIRQQLEARSHIRPDASDDDFDEPADPLPPDTHGIAVDRATTTPDDPSTAGSPASAAESVSGDASSGSGLPDWSAEDTVLDLREAALTHRAELLDTLQERIDRQREQLDDRQRELTERSASLEERWGLLRAAVEEAERRHRFQEEQARQLTQRETELHQRTLSLKRALKQRSTVSRRSDDHLAAIARERDAVLRLRDDIAGRRTALHREQAETESRKNALLLLQAEVEERRAAVTQSESELAERKAELESRTNEIAERLASFRDARRRQMDSRRELPVPQEPADTHSEALAQQNVLREQLKHQERLVADLSQQLDALQIRSASARGESDQLQARLADRERRLAEVERELANAAAERQDQQALAGTLEETTRALEEQRQATRSLREQHADLQAAFAELNEQADIRKTLIAEQDRERESLSRELAALREQLAEASRREDELQHEHQRQLDAREADAGTARAAADQSQQELAAASEQLARLQHENHSRNELLKQTTDDRDTLISERDSLTQERDQFAEECRTLRTERDGLAEQRDSAIAELNELTAEHQALNDSSTSLAEECERLAQENAETLADRDRLARECHVLIEERDALTAERDELAARHDGVAQERDAAVAEREQLEAHTRELTRERDTLKAGHDALIQERDALAHERDALTAERDELAARHDAVAQERDAAVAEREQLAAHTRELTRERDTLKADHDAVIHERDALAHKRDALTAERDELAACHDAVAQERDAAVAEREQLAAHTRELTHERDTLKADHDAVIHERDALTAERDELAACHDAVAQERDAAVAERERLAVECDALSESAAAAAADREEWQRKHDGLADELQALRDQHQHTESAALGDAAERTHELAAAHQAVQETADELHQLSQRHAELQAAFDQLTDRSSAQQTHIEDLESARQQQDDESSGLREQRDAAEQKLADIAECHERELIEQRAKFQAGQQELVRLREELERLRSSHEELTRQATADRDRLEELQRARDAAADASTRTEAERDGLLQRLADVESRHQDEQATLQRTIEELTRARDEAQQALTERTQAVPPPSADGERPNADNPAADGVLAGDDADAAALLEEIESLRAELNQVRLPEEQDRSGRDADGHDREERSAELERSLQQTQSPRSARSEPTPADAAQSDAARTEALEAQLAEQTRLIDELRTELEQQRADRNSAEAALAKLERSRNTAENEDVDPTADTAEDSGQHELLRTLQDSIEERDQLIRDLRNQMQALAAATETTGRSPAEAGADDRELQILSRELDRRAEVLDCRDEDLKERARQIARTEESLETQRRELIEARQQLEIARAEVQVAIGTSQAMQAAPQPPPKPTDDRATVPVGKPPRPSASSTPEVPPPLSAERPSADTDADTHAEARVDSGADARADANGEAHGEADAWAAAFANARDGAGTAEHSDSEPDEESDEERDAKLAELKSELASLFGIGKPPARPAVSEAADEDTALDDDTSFPPQQVDLSEPIGTTTCRIPLHGVELHFDEAGNFLENAAAAEPAESDHNEESPDAAVASFMEGILERARQNAGQRLPRELTNAVGQRSSTPSAPSSAGKGKDSQKASRNAEPPAPGSVSFIEQYMSGAFGDLNSGELSSHGVPHGHNAFRLDEAGYGADRTQRQPPRLDRDKLRQDMNSFRTVSTASVENALAAHARRLRQRTRQLRIVLAIGLGMIAVLSLFTYVVSSTSVWIPVSTFLAALVVAATLIRRDPSAIPRQRLSTEQMAVLQRERDAVEATGRGLPQPGPTEPADSTGPIRSASVAPVGNVAADPLVGDTDDVASGHTATETTEVEAAGSDSRDSAPDGMVPGHTAPDQSISNTMDELGIHRAADRDSAASNNAAADLGVSNAGESGPAPSADEPPIPPAGPTPVDSHDASQADQDEQPPRPDTF